MPRRKYSYIHQDLQKLARPIEELTPDPKNARTHGDRNMSAIRGSLKEFGFRGAIIAQKSGDELIVRAGNGRLEAARQLGWSHVPVLVYSDDDKTSAAFALADNRTAELAAWDFEQIAGLIKEGALDEEIDIGFSSEEIQRILDGEILPLGESDSILDGEDAGEHEGLTDPDEVPDAPEEPRTKTGDLWILGDHRLLCGDSTQADEVARLMDGKKACVVHADPPYGMGKEKDGVLNDNLYRAKLDQFQMEWWRAIRPHTEDNGSVYIWGTAQDLWRLWYTGGLADSERLTFRNEIVWAKGSAGAGGISHIGASGLRLYPQETERALFFMLGEQGFNNNAENYWEGWEPIQNYLKSQKDKLGWSSHTIKKIAGHSPSGHGDHWTGKSQWSMPTEEVYQSWQTAAKGDAFKREYDDIKREYDDIKREFYKTRAYFDNTHDNMTDVWQFERVKGEERHGHATPKPVNMIARAIVSSSPVGAIISEPFGGSGSTLIACEQTKRKCRMMELDRGYCDVIVKRWEDFTGKKAHLSKK